MDFTIPKNGKGENGRFTATEYTISLDMAKELSMVENNEQGKRARRYFIEIEKQFRAETRGTQTNDVMIATLYSEMERRIKAEAARDEYKKNLQRIAIASNLCFGEVSAATGLIKDIVVAAHCKSSSRPHRPQRERFIQLVLPLRELVEEFHRQIGTV